MKNSPEKNAYLKRYYRERRAREKGWGKKRSRATRAYHRRVKTTDPIKYHQQLVSNRARKKKLRADPEWKKRHNLSLRTRRRRDPEWRIAVNKRQAAHARERYRTDPTHRAKCVARSIAFNERVRLGLPIKRRARIQSTN